MGRHGGVTGASRGGDWLCRTGWGARGRDAARLSPPSPARPRPASAGGAGPHGARGLAGSGARAGGGSGWGRAGREGAGRGEWGGEGEGGEGPSRSGMVAPGGLEGPAGLEGLAEIRVAVVPVGGISWQDFSRLSGLVARHARVDLAEAASFYQEQQKSPFQHFRFSGCLRFNFVPAMEEGGRWGQLAAHRRVFGVIGVCNASHWEGIGAAYDNFMAETRERSEARVLRCFVFNPKEEQVVQDVSSRKHLITFPRKSWKELEYHVDNIMLDFAASILMDLEQRVLNANLSSIIAVPEFDDVAGTAGLQRSSSGGAGADEAGKHREVSEVQLAKKRQLGRLQKSIGDLCLLATSPKDAINHFNTAQELSRLARDPVWLGSALEGSACAVVMQAQPALWGGDRAFTQSVIDDVVELYEEALDLYRRHKRDSVLEIQALCRLTSFLAVLRPKEPAACLGHLQRLIECSSSIRDECTRTVIFLEIALVFGRLRRHRKAALWLYKACREAREAGMAAQPLHGYSGRLLEKDKRQDHAAILSTVVQGNFWEVVRFHLVEALYDEAASSGTEKGVWEAGAKMVCGFEAYTNADSRRVILNAMVESSDRLCKYPGSSSGYGIEFRAHCVRVREAPAFERVHKVGGKPKEDHGPFIFTPFAKEKKGPDDVVFVLGSTFKVDVKITSPFCLPIIVDKIALISGPQKSLSTPKSMKLAAGETVELTLEAIAVETGLLSITGCSIEALGMCWEVPFTNEQDVARVEVIGSMALLSAHLDVGSSQSGLGIVEGEERPLLLTMENISDVDAHNLNVNVWIERQLKHVNIANARLSEVDFPRTLKGCSKDSVGVIVKSGCLLKGADSCEEILRVEIVYNGAPCSKFCRNMELNVPLKIVPGPRMSLRPELKFDLDGLTFPVSVYNPSEVPLRIVSLAVQLGEGESLELSPTAGSSCNVQPEHQSVVTLGASGLLETLQGAQSSPPRRKMGATELHWRLENGSRGVSPANNFGLIESLLQKPIVRISFDQSERATPGPGSVGSLYNTTVRLKNHSHEVVEASVLLSCRAATPHLEPDMHLRPHIAGGRQLKLRLAPGGEATHRVAVAAPWPGSYLLECAPDRPERARYLVLSQPAALAPA